MSARILAGLFAVMTPFVLSGCASWAGGFKVEVPVAVPCKAAEPDRPAWPTERLAPGVDVYVFTIHAQAEIELREAYEGKLRAALAGCIAPITTP